MVIVCFAIKLGAKLRQAKNKYFMIIRTSSLDSRIKYRNIHIFSQFLGTKKASRSLLLLNIYFSANIITE